MTTRLTHDLTYDAPSAEVTSMLGDRAFREEVCVSAGVVRHQVAVEGSGAGMHVSIDQVHATDGIPSVAKRFVGDEINYVRVEEWTSPEHATVTVSIPGKPAEMSGTIALREGGGVTTQTVTMNIRVGVPLVGGKIESLLADSLRAALQVENKVGRDYLSR